ncbi:MAG: hypothetical protein WBE26_10105 [Phycisphaerae bacterium]
MLRRLLALLIVFVLVAVSLGIVIGFGALVVRISSYALLLLVPIACLTVFANVPSSHAKRVNRQAERVDSTVETDPGETEGLTGLWKGTARIWPTTTASVLRVLPIRMAITTDPIGSHLLRCKGRHRREQIVAAEVLEHDAANNDLDLRITVEAGNRLEQFEARLRCESGALAPEDETDPCTIELQPETPSVSQA